MKKYLTTLILAVLVSVSLISCEYGLMGYEGTRHNASGFKYEFTSNSLTLAKGDSESCEIHTAKNSPIFEIMSTSEDGRSNYGQVQGIAEGDTLLISYYDYEFWDTSDKSVDWHLNYFKEFYVRYFEFSIRIVGPSPMYQYFPNSEGITLVEIDSMCP